MAATVVCISRAIGAGGDQIGRGAAKQLGFRYVDDEIIERASEMAGAPADVIADAERRKGLVERALTAIATSGGADPLSYQASIEAFNPRLNAEGLIRDAIMEIASGGNVVIGAHAAAMQLGARPGVVRALITASDETRVRRIMEEVNLDEGAAQKALRDSDKARHDYFRRFYHVSDELPTHYDIVINTDLLSYDAAIRMITELAQA